MIKSNTLPAGIIETKDLQAFDKDIENGEIMLMCSDGILDSNIEDVEDDTYFIMICELEEDDDILDQILYQAIQFL